MRLGLVALALALLCACGGGGGGGSGGNEADHTSTAFSGTVATNTVPAGYSVESFSPGSGGNPAPVGGDGRYSARSFPLAQPPFLITAFPLGLTSQPQRQYGSLVSVALRGGTVNVTPLTSLLVARLLNHKFSDSGIDVHAARELQNVSDADISAAQRQVVAYLLTRPSKFDGSRTVPVDVSAVTDFNSMPFTVAPGDPYFEALKRLHDSLMESETLQGVAEHMLFGDDPPPDLPAMLSLDFVANCTISGTDDGTMPRGSTRIIVDGRGVTFGNVDLAFETGDVLSINAGPTGDGWQLSFTSRQASVSMTIFERSVSGISLSRASQRSDCLPVGEVSLLGKHPSVTALFRRLVASLSDLRFRCDAATSPGFQSGLNGVFFDGNGAMRVNVGGPSLHLTSLNIRITAPLVVVAGQASAPKLTGFSAHRFFTGGFDEFLVSVSDTGLIQFLSLSHQDEQGSQTQSCGT